MMRYTLFMLALLAAACSGGSAEKATEEADPEARKQALIAQIEAVEAELFADAASREIADAKAQEVVTLYTGYVDANPWDSISPHYLFKAAEVNIGIGQHKAAIGLYERLLEHYPEYDKRAETLYLIGFTYENHLDQMGKAREQYEALIETYPSHKLAEDARYAIENLGLSDEELIEKFKAMQEEQAVN